MMRIKVKLFFFQNSNVIRTINEIIVALKTFKMRKITWATANKAEV